MASNPEQYFIHANKYAPNSHFPVLVYRDVLPESLTEESASEFLQRHNWIKKGTWGHLPARHYHPATHECYGILKGESSFVIGRGARGDSGGTIIFVKAGDVIVLPAGTGHASVESSEGYRYIGVYPQIEGDNMGKKRYGHKFGNELPDHEALQVSKASAGIPVTDPVSGAEGPLSKLWNQRKDIQEMLVRLPKQHSDEP